MRARVLRLGLMLCGSQILLGGCCDRECMANAKRGLYSDQAKTRNESALALARCGDSAADTVPRLGQLIYDENVGVQSAAAYALRQIDTEQARKILKRAQERKRK